METMTPEEFYNKTGITKGYAKEILDSGKDPKWYIPAGAAFKAEPEVEEPVEDEVIEPTIPNEPTPEVTPTEPETAPETEPDTEPEVEGETEEEGGSVEVE